VTAGSVARELRDERTRSVPKHPVALESERLHRRRDAGRGTSAPPTLAPAEHRESNRKRHATTMERVGWITAWSAARQDDR